MVLLMSRRGMGWVSVRESERAEPLLRLNVEARTVDRMVELRDAALELIRKEP